MAADLQNIDAEIGSLNTLQWSVLVIAISAALLLAVITTRTVVLPVTRAVEVADRIAGGDMDTAIEVSGTREITRLGRAILIAESNRTFDPAKHYWQPLPTKEVAFYLASGYSLPQNPEW